MSAGAVVGRSPGKPEGLERLIGGQRRTVVEAGLAGLLLQTFRQQPDSVGRQLDVIRQRVQTLIAYAVGDLVHVKVQLWFMT